MILSWGDGGGGLVFNIQYLIFKNIIFYGKYWKRNFIGNYHPSTRLTVTVRVWLFVSFFGVRHRQNRRPRTCARPYSRGWTWDRLRRRAEWWCSNWSACSTCSSSCSTCCWCSCLPNRRLSSTYCCTPYWSPWSPCWAPYPASPRTSECHLLKYNVIISYINIFYNY